MHSPIVVDLCIVGAGAVGCALAREMSRFRLRVLLLERSDDVGAGATKANSGIVHGAYSSPRGSLRASLCGAGNRMYAQLDRELHFGFRRTGALVLAFSAEQEAALRGLYENGLAMGEEGLQLLRGEQVRSLEPAVSPAARAALLAPSVGVTSPYELAIALAENAVANGVQLRVEAEVTGIRPAPLEAGGGFVVTAAGRQHRARYVVNAAGVYAERVTAFLGQPGFRIIPRQGQYLLFDRGTGNILKRVIFQVPTRAGKGVLVTSTFHRNLMIGPDANEVAGPEDAGTTLAALQAIVAKARLSLPDFDLRQAITTFAGVRPTPSTGDFVIGPGPVPGFFHAAGIDSPGLTSAPAIAGRLRDLLADAGLELEPRSAFVAERPAIIVPKSLDPAEVRRRLALTGPERLVCRCEQVSEAEVLDALHRGIPVRSIDALKRRTRAGMGRCQGAFCRPRVSALIERETGFPAEEAIRQYEQRLAAKGRIRTSLLALQEKERAGRSPLDMAGCREDNLP